MPVNGQVDLSRKAFRGRRHCGEPVNGGLRRGHVPPHNIEPGETGPYAASVMMVPGGQKPLHAAFEVGRGVVLLTADLENPVALASGSDVVGVGGVPGGL